MKMMCACSLQAINVIRHGHFCVKKVKFTPSVNHTGWKCVCFWSARTVTWPSPVKPFPRSSQYDVLYCNKPRREKRNSLLFIIFLNIVFCSQFYLFPFICTYRQEKLQKKKKKKKKETGKIVHSMNHHSVKVINYSS